MFRGFRWQLLVFFVALLCFAFSAVFRVVRSARAVPNPPAGSVTPTTPAAAAPSPTASIDLAPAPRESPPAYRFREAVVGAPARLNPLFAHLNPADQDIASLIFESLVEINEYGEAAPLLAEEIIVSGDGLEYVVRLRGDIFWQDGVPFTTLDVAYTMGMLADPEYGRYSGAQAFWSTVETQVLGERLLRFRLAQPYAGFPYMLTVGILPEHALRGTGMADLARHPINLAPIGTGAYQLESLRAAPDGGIREATLAFAPFFQERPEARDGYHLREIRFTFYPDAGAALDSWRAGHVDGLATGAADLLGLPGSALYAGVESTLGVLIFNWRDERFRERRLRGALALSLDTPALVARSFGSSATYADSPYPPTSAAYQPEAVWTSFDLEGARTMLAGAIDGDEFTLLVEDRPELVSLAEGMVGAWAEIGLNVGIEALDAEAQVQRLEAGDFDAAIIEQRVGGNPDLFRFWHPAQAESGFNYGAADDTGIAETLELARRAVYGFRQAELLAQFQTLFAEQFLAIPLYYPVTAYAVSDRIEGVGLGFMSAGADRFGGIKSWRAAALAG